MEKVFAVISAVLLIAAAPPYILDTIHGKTKPERASWFILFCIATIGFISQLIIEPNWSLVFLGFDAVDCFAVFILSIFYGVGGFNRLDRFGLAIATIGVITSIVAHEPLIALFGVIMADVAGTGLTAWKVYLQPGTETTISWILAGVAGIFGLLAIGRYEFDLFIWPFYLVLANLSVPIAQSLGHIHKQSAKH